MPSNRPLLLLIGLVWRMGPSPIGLPAYTHAYVLPVLCILCVRCVRVGLFPLICKKKSEKSHLESVWGGVFETHSLSLSLSLTHTHTGRYCGGAVRNVQNPNP
jgi:hypothetical protein